MNSINNQSFDFAGIKKAINAKPDFSKTTKAWVRQSETLRRPDMVSHNALHNKRKRAYRKSMHAVTVEDKYKMLHNLKKGQNKEGGTFGGIAPDREPSPSFVVSTDGMIKIKPMSNMQRF